MSNATLIADASFWALDLILACDVALSSANRRLTSEGTVCGRTKKKRLQQQRTEEQTPCRTRPHATRRTKKRLQRVKNSMPSLAYHRETKPSVAKTHAQFSTFSLCRPRPSLYIERPPQASCIPTTSLRTPRLVETRKLIPHTLSIVGS